jgi:hypothetical protein
MSREFIVLSWHVTRVIARSRFVFPRFDSIHETTLHGSYQQTRYKYATVLSNRV